MINFLKEVWQGTGKCLTFDCQVPIKPHATYCDDCMDHMESLRQGTQEDRERAYMNANKKEWQRLLKKYHG